MPVAAGVNLVSEMKGRDIFIYIDILYLYMADNETLVSWRFDIDKPFWHMCE